MNNRFDELTKSMAPSVTRRGALKKFGVGLAGMALAGFLAVPTWAGGPSATSSTVFDPAGDAVFPFDLYGAPVPPYLDVISASVSYSQGVFHFEIQTASDIPANGDPGFTPSVNHLGATFGISTDRTTKGKPYKFFGHTDTYHFNFLVGALYSTDSGVGLESGWSGFLIDVGTFTVAAIPVQIRGDTMIFETSAAALGNPSSFDFVVASECDPVPIPEEKHKSALLVDFAPDHGVATWPAQ